MDCQQVIKETIPRKTLSKWRFRLVIVWIGLGTILGGVFLFIETKESRLDFRCDVARGVDRDFVRDECYPQYLQNQKLGIPPYLFILVNVFLIPIVTFIYSLCVKSTVKTLERSHQDAKREPTNQRPSRRLFFAYLFQLVVSIALRITFIVLLETSFIYLRIFPCSIRNPLSVKFLFNRTQSVNLFTCFHDRADFKNIFTRGATVANGIFLMFTLLQILWILRRAMNAKRFMENQQFYADHLKSNSDETETNPKSQTEPEGIPLVERQHGTEDRRHAEPQRDFKSAIWTLKENCKKGTEQLSDLKQPFRRRYPGEGYKHDLTMDNIYVNVAIHEARAPHIFQKDQDRSEQLNKYPPSAKDCHFAKPDDIIDQEHRNVLVVGRPGIGKTSLTTRMLRLWAKGEAFNEEHQDKANFKVVFLVKFRRFNQNAAELMSLRDLLARAETVQSLDDSVWNFINEKSTEVLLIFDGFDEYSRKQDIDAQEDDQTYKNDVKEKMPLPVLYNKVATGKLLDGASIVTTTRPTAVKYVAHVDFHRTVEILGFTSENIKDYVKNFTQSVPGAEKRMWEHIESNRNLFSLCYIPMNCFLICHCLLLIIMYESEQALPTKMTDIFKMTVKTFFCSHNRKGLSQEKLEELKATQMYKPFEKFPKDFQKVFSSLGKIAFKGIKEGRLIFESSEVSGLEECGLFHKLPDKQPPPLSDEEPKPQFCFIHLTVQEFFAAKHLVDAKKNEEIERFVCNHIRDGPWQMVLQFVAGLLKGSRSNIFIKLLPKWTREMKTSFGSERKKLACWPATKEDKTLAVQVCKCLYEIKDEQQKELLQKKIRKSTLNAIDFRLCSLASTDLAAILQFLENAEGILFINLMGNGLGDLDANQVKKFIVNRGCKVRLLDLSGNSFTDKAAKDLAEVLTHSRCELQLLSLNKSNLTDKGAEDLAGALKHRNCKLKELWLGSNYFTDKGVKDLASALRHSNCKLKQLYIDGNNFTEEGRRYLIDAGKDSTVKIDV